MQMASGLSPPTSRVLIIRGRSAPRARAIALFVTTNGALNEAALKAAGVEAVVKLPDRVLHLLTGLNADQYGAEMRGQLAVKPPE